MHKFSHLWFYFLFVVFIVLALVGLYLLRYQPLLQFVVVIISATFYFLIGTIYHWLKGDLTKQIVLEFAGMAAFVILAFATLTFWRVI